MIRKKVILLVLAGLILGIAAVFVVMSAFPVQQPGTVSTPPAIQPVVQQKITPGAEEPQQFTSLEEARVFLMSHTVSADAPVLLEEGQNPVATPGVTSGAVNQSVPHTTRSWQFDVDTTTFKPDEYIVTVDAILQDVSATALFTVLEPSPGVTASQSQGTRPVPLTDDHYLTIDPIGDHYRGDTFTITGHTNLAAEDEMLVQVYSSSFRPTQKSQSGEFSGATGTVKVSSVSRTVTAASSASSPGPDGERKYSTTTVQIKDVDEADIVKTDGKYIYVVSGNRFHILNAYPAGNASVIATMQFSGVPLSLYLDGDRLVLVSSESQPRGFIYCSPKKCGSTIPSATKTHLYVFSAKDPVHPALVRDLVLDGSYKDSRMIGSMLYFVTNNNVDISTDTVVFPGMYDSRRGSSVPPVYHFNSRDREFSLTTVGAVDVMADDPVKAKTFLIGSAGTVYVSLEKLYIAISGQGDDRIPAATTVYSFALDNGRLTYTAHGVVDGTLLNQFSMDEYGGNLRVATTLDTGNGRMNSQYSEVSVLDGQLRLIGSVSNIAKNEKIYAARFMGERLYLVTFRETDPLFVIDLSDPRNPAVLGELQIPGFSSYLHPYDATHLIGVGKESTRGGLKLALFDVGDVNNPQLVGEKILGGSGSDSEVLRDHKAFLFDKEKNLLVLPVHIVEDPSSYRSVRPVWGGAYVFGVDVHRGFTEKGTVVHYRESGSTSTNAVKRAFFIEDVLYTFASNKIVMSDLKNDTSLLGEVELP